MNKMYANDDILSSINSVRACVNKLFATSFTALIRIRLSFYDAIASFFFSDFDSSSPSANKFVISRSRVRPDVNKIKRVNKTINLEIDRIDRKCRIVFRRRKNIVRIYVFRLF